MSSIISYIVLSFHKLAISAAYFLVVFDHFGICKKCSSSSYHSDILTENIMKKLQKLYGLPTNLMADNKSPVICEKTSLQGQFIQAIYSYNFWKLICEFS